MRTFEQKNRNKSNSTSSMYVKGPVTLPEHSRYANDHRHCQSNRLWLMCRGCILLDTALVTMEENNIPRDSKSPSPNKGVSQLPFFSTSKDWGLLLFPEWVDLPMMMVTVVFFCRDNKVS